MPKIKDIIGYLESLSPLALQEDYDNAGLLVGDCEKTVTEILICLDTTEAVIEEAIRRKCQLIISHHPILFRGIKKLTGNHYVERVLIKAIKNDIAIYAIHTNLDNIKDGVNATIAEKLKLCHTRILKPKQDQMRKLITFIPVDHTMHVLDAMHEAGAGVIGDYDHCSFRITGTGRFKPGEHASPHIGAKDEMEEVREDRVEVIFPFYRTNHVLQALRSSHPYEEVAYYLHVLENDDDTVGSGLIGELPEAMKTNEFLIYLKDSMHISHYRYTPVEKETISRIAVCGGAGSFLLPHAIKQGADAFISADFKYHEFFDGEGKILIADIGHYESEVFTKELIYQVLNKKFSNIALRLSEVNTNPIRYI